MIDGRKVERGNPGGSMQLFVQEKSWWCGRWLVMLIGEAGLRTARLQCCLAQHSIAFVERSTLTSCQLRGEHF